MWRCWWRTGHFGPTLTIWQPVHHLGDSCEILPSRAPSGRCELNNCKVLIGLCSPSAKAGAADEPIP